MKLLEREALKYLRYKDRLSDIPEEEIELYRKDTEDAYKRLTSSIKTVEFVDFEPYTNCYHMQECIDRDWKLLISNLHNDSPLLPGQLNLQFRAVHDYYHYLTGALFSFHGEMEIYRVQEKDYSSSIGKKILWSEVVLQAAYKEFFGTFAPTQKIII